MKKDSKIVRVPTVRGAAMTVVTFGCLHLTKEDKKYKETLLSYIEATQPDGIVSGGDLSDCGPFRSSSKNSEGGSMTPGQIKKALEIEQEATWDFYLKLRKVAPVSWIAAIRGNHEFRLDRLSRSSEIFKNAASYETYKSDWFPADYHAKDYDLGQELHIGDARFIHGRYYGRGHLKKHYDAYGPNTYYWHTHEFSVEAFKHNGKGNAPEVASLGCGEKILPDWMMGAPHNWSNCFQQFIFEPNGEYSWVNIRVRNGKAHVPEGFLL